jgi:peptidyl-prolyl cis-trans isomerase D
MIRTINKHQRWLMIVIAILSLPFLLYFVKSDWWSAMHSSDQVARIYDQNVTHMEKSHYDRLFKVAAQLGMIDFLQGLAPDLQIQDLMPGSPARPQIYYEFMYDLIILRHEAARLGIRPGKPEVVDLIRDMRVFRGPSGFDANRYDEVVQTLLPSMGFGEAQLEELAGDEFCMNKIRDMVAAGVSVSPTESKINFEQAYGKVAASVARLRLEDFAKDVKVTDDDVRNYYGVHKADFKTEEKRKVEFVSLALTDQQKKLQGKERIDILQKLADRANDFTQALLEKGADFKPVAAKFQLPVRETGEFTASTPDPALKADPQLVAAAFQLTPQEPISDAIQAADGFCILHLSGVVEARPLTLEEAKPKIVDAIKMLREREMVLNKGAQAAHELRETLRSGAPLNFALEKVNLKVEKIPPFSVADEINAKPDPEKAGKEPADLRAIKQAAGDLNPGEVSEFFPTNDGGFIAIVEKREPPDEARVRENKTAFEERFLSNKRRLVFFEWLRDRQNEAGVTAPKDEPAAPQQNS